MLADNEFLRQETLVCEWISECKRNPNKWCHYELVRIYEWPRQMVSIPDTLEKSRVNNLLSLQLGSGWWLKNICCAGDCSRTKTRVIAMKKFDVFLFINIVYIYGQRSEADYIDPNKSTLASWMHCHSCKLKIFLHKRCLRVKKSWF